MAMYFGVAKEGKKPQFVIEWGKILHWSDGVKGKRVWRGSPVFHVSLREGFVNFMESAPV
jgi:hypothetical protein